MRRDELGSMSVDELWDLREQVDAQLGSKLVAEKAKLDERLSKLRAIEPKAEKRPYPKVRPKYHNPKNRKETWAGRGKQPRWLVAQLKSGKKLADFLIERQRQLLR